MAREAVTVTANGSVRRYGREGFATSDDFDGGTESVVALNDTTDQIPGIPLKHHKVVSGVLTEMDSGEKTTVDATIPTILYHQPQIVETDRDPTGADDLTKGFFDGAEWKNSITSSIFVLKDSQPAGSASWVNITSGGGGSLGYIQLLRTTSYTLTDSAAQVTFDTTVQDSGDLFSHNGSGTLTALVSGKIRFQFDAAFTLTSGTITGRGRLMMYTASGGSYSIVSGAQSTTRISTTINEGVLNFQWADDVVSGHTYRIYGMRSEGTATIVLDAAKVRWHAHLLEAA